jgi:hypothetical protein
MYKIVQYRPSYFSGYENEFSQFNTIEEFLNIDFVKNFTSIVDYKGYTSEGFFVAEDIGYIFHINYNPGNKQIEQWGVAEILEGDISQLKEMFFNKWGLKSLRQKS